MVWRVSKKSPPLLPPLVCWVRILYHLFPEARASVRSDFAFVAFELRIPAHPWQLALRDTTGSGFVVSDMPDAVATRALRTLKNEFIICEQAINPSTKLHKRNLRESEPRVVMTLGHFSTIFATLKVCA